MIYYLPCSIRSTHLTIYICLTLYLTRLTYPLAAYYMTVNSNPINHYKADSGLNITPCPILSEQLITRLSAKKTSASKTFLFSDSLLKAVCFYNYSQVKDFPVKKSITLNLLDLSAYALLFSLPTVLKSGRS
jgi:hypothetical protein